MIYDPNDPHDCFYLWQCGCGTETFLTAVGGELNECDCPEALRRSSTRVTKLRPDAEMNRMYASKLQGTGTAKWSPPASS